MQVCRCLLRTTPLSQMKSGTHERTKAMQPIQHEASQQSGGQASQSQRYPPPQQMLWQWGTTALPWLIPVAMNMESFPTGMAMPGVRQSSILVSDCTPQLPIIWPGHVHATRNVKSHVLVINWGCKLLYNKFLFWPIYISHISIRTQFLI
jgi:hypothetical protein